MKLNEEMEKTELEQKEQIEGNKRVVLYAIPDCPKCKNLKGKLMEKGILFDLYEMGEKEVADMIEKGFTSAPILNNGSSYLNYKNALKWVAEA